MSLLVFATVFLVYLRALPPALAPWRDAGEMTTAAWTLGVAHPTSYPLFVLIGHALRAVPLGDFAYRLNLLSAVCGAGAAALLFRTTRRRRGAWAALAAAAWLAFNAAFWEVSQVSEMYALWALGAVGLLALAEAAAAEPSERLWPGLCFLSGLALANRLDFLLWAPGLLWLALSGRPGTRDEDGLWAGTALVLFPAAAALTGSNYPFAALVALTLLWRARGPGMGRRLALAAAAGAAGLSVYLYLPVRSATGPFLDWNHPATPANFLESVLRTRYGGTLDLISRSYATGALFGDNLRLWGAHLWDAFGPAGLAAGLAGCAAGFRADRRRWLGRFACWWWSGPVFLFLANMPPNAYAAAIVRPHYLLSDVVLVFWAADGVAALAGSARALAPALAAAALVWPLWRGVPARQERRWRLYSYDYAKNAFRAAPPGAAIVAKKDVELYALWHYQTVQGWRPDARVIAQGLSGAGWYQADWSRRDPDLPLSDLRAPEGWSALAAGGRAVLATQDVELPGTLGASARPCGVLLQVSPGTPPDGDAEWEFAVRRGPYRYGSAPDYFGNDLIESAALASFRAGTDLQRRGRADAAERRILDAWRMEWQMPDAPQFLGYMAAKAGRWAEADALASVADRLFAAKMAEADAYRSLEPVKEALRRETAQELTQHGVVLERLGRRDEAAALDRRALAVFPLSQTRYNLGVLAWGRDWDAAEENMAEAVRLDPGNAQARRYLDELRARGAGVRAPGTGSR